MKIVKILQTVFILVLTQQIIFASNLILNKIEHSQSRSQFLEKYSNIVYMDQDICLSVSENMENTIAIWDESSNYFVCYPLYPYSKAKLLKHGEIIYTDNTRIIFESKNIVLNNYPEFHKFKISRIFNRPISAPKNQKQNNPYYKTKNNPVIQQLVNNVSQDSLEYFISALQGLERYTENSSAINSSNFIKEYFEQLGFDSVYFQEYTTGWIPNVVAIKYGQATPDEIYLTGGHYDVYANGAPGADDNGSGSASVMEAARVLSQMSFKRTLKFVLFSGEELGLYGSEAYAQNASSENENILGMINMDMIGYVAPGDAIDVDVLSNDNSSDLYAAYQTFTNTYVPDLAIVDGSLPFGASSDHASFWNAGYKAIFPFEDSDDYSPYIHSDDDILGTSVNSLELAQLGTQALVASLAGLAEIAETKICGYVKSAETLESLSGVSVTVDAETYFTDENGYFSTAVLLPGEYTITISNTEYEDIISTVQIEEYQMLQKSFYMIPNGSIRPFVHLVSEELDDDNIGNSIGDDDGIADAGETIELFLEFWNSGNEDAASMEVTISLENSSDEQWINISEATSTISNIFVNDSIQTSAPFVFSISENSPDNTQITFNAHLNYGPYSNDQTFTLFISKLGDVLIVEDDNGDGGLGDYTRALDSLRINYDLENENVTSETINHYNTVIWFCGDDYSTTLSASNQTVISSFLENGGNLFICGNDIGYDINTSSFYSNYLKADYLQDGSQITSVNGITDDPISGDFSSGLSMDDNWVDVIEPMGGSSSIFTYTSDISNTCAVSYEDNYKLVYLGFNFENIPNFSDQQQLMDNVMTFFNVGQITSISEGDYATVNNFSLYQNYPNPFNPETVISYTIQKKGQVKLQVFNALGQLVQTLTDKEQQPGTYEIKFMAQNLSSGIYYYYLKTDNLNQAKKMVLTK